MNKPVELKAVKHDPDPQLIQMLENWLDEARRGDLVEFEGIARHRSGDIYTGGSGDRNSVYVMFGALTSVSLEYRERFIDGR